MIRRARSLSAVAGFVVACVSSSSVWSQNLPPLPDPGSVSNENLRGQQLLRRETDPDPNIPGVIGPAASPTVIGPSGGPTFVLKKVVFDKSEFLSQQELDAIAAPYIGRRVDNAELQRLLKAVNDVYAERRQITAIAFLPKQDLKSGMLRIGIVEGRVGAVNVQGGKSVKPEAITDAVKLVPGTVFSAIWRAPPFARKPCSRAVKRYETGTVKREAFARVSPKRRRSAQFSNGVDRSQARNVSVDRLQETFLAQA